MGRKNKILAFFGAILFLISCGNGPYYSDIAEVKLKGWDFSDSIVFEVPISDTLSVFDLHVSLKHSKDYPYSNLILFLSGTGPKDIKSVDTLECVLAKPNGQWLGNSFGSEVSHDFLFKQGAKFPFKGDYKFSFTHAMRDTVLENITNLGLIIEHRN